MMFVHIFLLWILNKLLIYLYLIAFTYVFTYKNLNYIQNLIWIFWLKKIKKYFLNNFLNNDWINIKKTKINVFFSQKIAIFTKITLSYKFFLKLNEYRDK